MIAIVDYGVGNLFSLKSSFEAIGVATTVSGDPQVLRQADKIILPGVGAFEDASRKLFESGLADLLKELANEGKPIMGICLGMQLLFDKSFEYGEHKGLGLIKGEIRPIKDFVQENLKIPHMGWNELKIKDKNHQLFKYISEGDFVYFVHSYFATDCEKNTLAVSEYGTTITAVVGNKNVLGCQFHPEKSGRVGLNILKAFAEGGNL